jgi:hypothetical protein
MCTPVDIYKTHLWTSDETLQRVGDALVIIVSPTQFWRQQEARTPILVTSTLCHFKCTIRHSKSSPVLRLRWRCCSALGSPRRPAHKQRRDGAVCSQTPPARWLLSCCIVCGLLRPSWCVGGLDADLPTCTNPPGSPQADTNSCAQQLLQVVLVRGPAAAEESTPVHR